MPLINKPLAISYHVEMAHPYKVNDEDEDFKDLDPAVAEDMAFAKALQNSLEVCFLPQDLTHSILH